MDNPDFIRNAFSQRNILYFRWITICFCNYLITQSRMSEVEHHIISFVSIIFLLISVTCSCTAVVLTASSPTFSLTFSNYISIRTRRVKNPPLEYNFTVFIIDLANFPAVRVGAYSQVINMIFREKVTRNGIPFMNMASAIKVKICAANKILL